MYSVSNLSNHVFPAIDHHRHCVNTNPQITRHSIHLPVSRRTEIRAHVTDNIPAVKSKSVSHEDVINDDKRVIVGTYGRTPVVLTSGKGCKLYDVNDKEYIDLTSGIAVNALGHGDPDWVQAITDQAKTLAHVSNIYYTVPQVCCCMLHITLISKSIF